jgi:hypothetical protein
MLGNTERSQIQPEDVVTIIENKYLHPFQKSSIRLLFHLTRAAVALYATQERVNHPTALLYFTPDAIEYFNSRLRVKTFSPTTPIRPDIKLQVRKDWAIINPEIARRLQSTTKTFLGIPIYYQSLIRFNHAVGRNIFAFRLMQESSMNSQNYENLQRMMKQIITENKTSLFQLEDSAIKLKPLMSSLLNISPTDTDQLMDLAKKV